MQKRSCCLQWLFFFALLFLLQDTHLPVTAQDLSIQDHSRYRSRIETVLSLSGGNRRELETFLTVYPRDSQLFEAASFLVAHLPVGDAVSMTSEELKEHVDTAFLARRLMPWEQEVPWEVFLRYVVPHRISQEPVQRWRKRLFLELSPRLQDSRTIEEAIREINKWCFLKADFSSSSPHDQGPLTTMLRGRGRCEELVILAACAARSVGIPVRPCYTPAWQFTNGNHAWMEVWTRSGWKYLGAGEPGTELDHSWFSPFAPFMILALSSAYGDLEANGEQVYRQGDGYTLVNSTRRYTTSFPLEVSVIGIDGAPAPDSTVFVSLYNSGTFRPIARVVCDENGKGAIELGRGTVLLTVTGEGKSDYELVSIGPNAPNRAALDLRRHRLPSGDFLLPFGTREKESVKRDVQSAGNAEESPLTSSPMDLRELEASRRAEEDRYKRVIGEFLGIGKEDAAAWKDPLARALLSSGGNCFELMSALITVPAEQAETLKKYIEAMDDKDLAECSASSLLADIRSALQTRKEAQSEGLCTYDDDLFLHFVLNNRVYHEAYSHWRPFLKNRFASFHQKDLHRLIRQINEYVSTLDKTEGGLLGPLMAPDVIVRAGRIVSEEERGIVSAAMLRALGVPARYLKEWKWVEYYTGVEWLPFYPDRPGHAGNRKASELSEQVYADPAHLEIAFLCDGKPCSEKEAVYRQDFSISRFDEKGFFQSLTPEITFDEKSSSYRLRIPAGNYFIIAARRNALKEPAVRVIPFTCRSGQRESLRIPLPFVAP